MSTLLKQEITAGVRELITNITGFQIDSEQFLAIEKQIHATINKSNTPFYLSRNDVNKEIDKMAEKFMFHSFFKHANYLKTSYAKYIDDSVKGTELINRLNVVKLMLTLSTRPTEEFWNHPERFEFLDHPSSEEIAADEINWGEYLKEGIETCRDFTETHSSSESDSGEFSEFTTAAPALAHAPATIKPVEEHGEEYNFGRSRQNLLDEVQNTWWSCPVPYTPPSGDAEARVALAWDAHLEKITGGLIKIDKTRIISEYKVMREIMWQLFRPHTSVVFGFTGNRLEVNENVTISSVRQATFASCLRQNFMPCIETMHEFKQFEENVSQNESGTVPITYRSYLRGIKEIIQPVWNELIDLETEIREQNHTMTLLKLSQRLNEIFKPLFILKKVHNQVIGLDYRKITQLEASLGLISRQRMGLRYSITQLEEDIRLTLYLHTLRHYFTILQNWFVHSDYLNYTDEFMIVNKNTINSETCEDQCVNILLAENVEKYYESDRILQVIGEQVLQIARNVQLLRLLKKYHSYSAEETIYETFIRLFLEELSNFNSTTPPLTHPSVPTPTPNDENNFLTEIYSHLSELDDNCMLAAFETCFEKQKPPPPLNLFQTITKQTKHFFPMRTVPEQLLQHILKDRFTVSGLLVKNLLIEEYSFEKEFTFLHHIFLFSNNLTLPFYRRLFRKLNSCSESWGNPTRLTSHLHDVIVDEFPQFCPKSKILVAENWWQCRNPVVSCEFIKMEYAIKWPLNLVITEKHQKLYKEVFGFLLKVKWARYTLTSLPFDVFVQEESKQRKSLENKLKCVRFNLLNLVASVHFFVFGLFDKIRKQFELDFEKSSDLQSIIKAHSCYINGIYAISDRVRRCCGFGELLECVKNVMVLWTEWRSGILVEELSACWKSYESSSKLLDPIINPVYLYDF